MAGKTLGEEFAEEMGMVIPEMKPAGGYAKPPTRSLSGEGIDPYGEASAQYGDPEVLPRSGFGLTPTGRSNLETGVEIGGALSGAGYGPKVAKKLTEMGIKMGPNVGRVLGAGAGEALARQATYDEGEGNRALETGKSFARGALGEAVGLKANDWVLKPLGGKVVGFANRAEGYQNPLARGATLLLRRTVNPFHGKLDLGAEEALAQLRPHGVSPSPGQVSNSGWIDRFENVIDASMTGQGRIRAQRGAAADVAEQMTRDYVESFVKTATQKDSGDLLTAALDNSAEIFLATTKQNYRATSRAIPAGRDRVQIKRLTGVAKIHRKNIEVLGRGMGAEQKKLLDDILLTDPKSGKFTRPDTISFDEATRLRSALLARERSATDPLASQTEGVVKQLIHVLDHQMGLTARNASPEAYRLFRKAGEYHAKGKTGINNRAVKAMQNQMEPERVYTSVAQNGTPSRIHKIRRFVEDGVAKGKTDPLTWESVQGQWMDDVLRHSVDAKTEKLNGLKMLERINTYGDARLGELFPVDRGRAFKRFARTLYITQKSASPDDPMSIVIKMMQGSAVIGLMAAPFAAAALGGDKSKAAAVTLPTAGLIVLGPVALSRLFTNDKAIRLMTTGMTHGPTTAVGRTAAQTLASQLDVILPAGSAYTAEEPGAKSTTQSPQGGVPSIGDLRSKGIQ